jgi:hypothetical protein
MATGDQFAAISAILARITEKHGALAESGQLLSIAQRQNEELFAENERRVAQNEKRFAENQERFAQVTRNFEITLDSIKALENIALAHEQHALDNRP